MKYFICLNDNGYISGRYTSGIHTDIPPEAIEVSDETFNASMNPDLSTGKWHVDSDGLLSVSESNLCQDAPVKKSALYSRAIDNFILSKINPLPYDYTSVEQAGQWASNPNTSYQEEARLIYTWCIQCQLIEYSVLTLETIVSSADEAIALLPPFPFD